jgi:predicted methyltransferase
VNRIWLSLALALPLAAQVAREANSQYQTPDGRRTVAATLSAPDRDERQKPRDLIQAMGLERGMAVADVGTGIGYMLPFLSGAVGPSGKVFAEGGRALTHLRLNKPEVIKEIEANHFRLVSQREQIKDVQYMLVLEKN